MSVSNLTPGWLTPRSSPGTSTFDPKILLRGVWRHFHFVIVVLVLGTTLGYVARRSVTPKYTSSVSILIDPKRPGTHGADATFANLSVDNNKISSVEVILLSSRSLSKVVQAGNTAHSRDFGHRVRAGDP